MVKLCGVPLQLFADGVTVIVAVFIALVAFVAVKDAISPAPLAARPIVGSLLAQLLTVPATELLKLIADVDVLLHTVWLDTEATSGVGLTVIANIWVLPAQPFAVGVTVIVDVFIAFVAFVAVKDKILPVPLA